LPKLVEQHLNAKATVEDVSINPLLLSVELQGLSITEPDGMPALQISRLRVDFETSSLLRLALTFKEILIEKPVINADLDAGENLNLARLLSPREKQASEDKKSRRQAAAAAGTKICHCRRHFQIHRPHPEACGTHPGQSGQF